MSFGGRPLAAQLAAQELHNKLHSSPPPREVRNAENWPTPENPQRRADWAGAQEKLGLKISVPNPDLRRLAGRSRFLLRLLRSHAAGAATQPTSKRSARKRSVSTRREKTRSRLAYGAAPESAKPRGREAHRVGINKGSPARATCRRRGSVRCKRKTADCTAAGNCASPSG